MCRRVDDQQPLTFEERDVRLARVGEGDVVRVGPIAGGTFHAGAKVVVGIEHLDVVGEEAVDYVDEPVADGRHGVAMHVSLRRRRRDRARLAEVDGGERPGHEIGGDDEGAGLAGTPVERAAHGGDQLVHRHAAVGIAVEAGAGRGELTESPDIGRCATFPPGGPFHPVTPYTGRIKALSSMMEAWCASAGKRPGQWRAAQGAP